MDELWGSLGGNIIDLANTATVFGQGAIASDISGNPIYSQDPAAAAYAVGTSRAATGAANLVPLLLFAVVLFFFFKK